MIALDNRLKYDLIEHWYREYATFLFHFACQFVDQLTAEESVQETFRIVCGMDRLDAIEHPKTWLWKITRNVIRNNIRDRQKWVALLVDTELRESTLGHQEDEQNVELMYGGLISAEDLHLLKLLAVDGHTYRSAGKELNLSAEACRKRAKRAGAELQKKLKKDET